MSRAAMIAVALAVTLMTGEAGAAERPIGARLAAAGEWRRVATTDDRARLRDWRKTWVAAVAAAQGRDGGAMARDAAFYAPDQGLAGPMPPPGAYRCRTVKLGAQAGSPMPGFVAYPAQPCRIESEGKAARLEQTGGPQRPAGVLFPDGSARAVFLGTLMLGDEQTALAYGRDANRDLAGVVARIGPRRWRIALPAPKFESQLDLIELVPAN